MTAIFHVPPSPLNYLPRPDQLEPLVGLLLSDRPEAVGVVGVQGMGGIGKSVLAAAAARDERIERRFPDGIFWIAVGQSPDLVSLQRKFARDLLGLPSAEIQFLGAASWRTAWPARRRWWCWTTSGSSSTPNSSAWFAMKNY